VKKRSKNGSVPSDRGKLKVKVEAVTNKKIITDGNQTSSFIA